MRQTHSARTLKSPPINKKLDAIDKALLEHKMTEFLMEASADETDDAMKIIMSVVKQVNDFNAKIPETMTSSKAAFGKIVKTISARVAKFETLEKEKKVLLELTLGIDTLVDKFYSIVLKTKTSIEAADDINKHKDKAIADAIYDIGGDEAVNSFRSMIKKSWNQNENPKSGIINKLLSKIRPGKFGEIFESYGLTAANLIEDLLGTKVSDLEKFFNDAKAVELSSENAETLASAAGEGTASGSGAKEAVVNVASSDELKDWFIAQVKSVMEPVNPEIAKAHIAFIEAVAAGKDPKDAGAELAGITDDVKNKIVTAFKNMSPKPSKDEVKDAVQQIADATAEATPEDSKGKEKPAAGNKSPIAASTIATNNDDFIKRFSQLTAKNRKSTATMIATLMDQMEKAKLTPIEGQQRNIEKYGELVGTNIEQIAKLQKAFKAANDHFDKVLGVKLDESKTSAEQEGQLLLERLNKLAGTDKF
jgi:hypothetical protein